MNIVIYARFSSHSQTEQSIEGQLQVCHEYAKRQGYNVIGEYIDRAISGTTDNRPDFLRMIDDSSKKQFQGVLVYQLDRFARNRYDSAIYKAKLKKNGVRVLSARENISDDASGILVEGLLEAIAEYYSAELAQKVKRGMDINAQKCLSNGGSIPLGFKVDKASKRYVVDTDGAAAVKMVFEMYDSGMIISDICDKLNAQGYRTAHGAAFNKNSLRLMLHNKKYIGVYTFDGKEIPGGMPRIISDELFNRVQDRLKANGQYSGHYKAKQEYILTTKLFCGHCKELMVGVSGKTTSPKPYYYYRCRGVQQEACDKKPVRKEVIEDIVVNECRKQLTDENIDMIARETVALCEREKDSQTLKRLEGLLAENERKMQNLTDMLLTAPDNVRKLLYDQVPVLEKEKADLEQQIAEERLTHINLTEDEVMFFLTQLRAGDVDDLKYRKMLVNVFVNAVYLYDDRIITHFNTGGKPVEITSEIMAEAESTFLNNNGSPENLPSYFGSWALLCREGKIAGFAICVRMDVRRKGAD